MRAPAAAPCRSSDIMPTYNKPTLTAKGRRLALILCSALVMLPIALGSASCSSKKNAAAPAATSSKRPKVAALRNPEVSELAATYSPWTTFYAPFSMRLSKPVSFNISGRATMVRDQAIQLSMRMLGMEVAVAYINADSATIVDKFHKYIVSVPFPSIAGRTNLTVADLQNLLLGQAFYPGSGTITAGEADAQFSMEKSGDTLILTPRRTPAGATWYFTVGPGPELKSMSVKPDGLETFMMTFSDIVAGAAGSVASSVEASGSFRDKELKAAVYWNMDKAKWNEPRTIGIPDYSGYKQLSVTDLIQALKKF